MNSELGSDVSLFAYNCLSNKIDDNYMDEMINTELTKNTQEELNLQIFK